MLRTLLFLAIGVPFLAAFGSWTNAAGVPHFEPATCADLPDSGEMPARLHCGVVRVPRDYAHPDGPAYALAVVVIKSLRQPAQPDPVVYISGGPGAPLTIYAGFQARHPYAADRDLILMDQRGMGRSEPRLCPELQGDLVKAKLAVVTQPTPATLEAAQSSYAACREAIRSRGIDPDNFGTATTVEDFDLLRRALGVTRWNVVGESYGTTVAMTLLAHHPESIRSAVLDSLNPPDAYFGMPWSERVARARDALFAACGVNPACHAAYPDLAGLYHEAAAQIAQDAPNLPLPVALHVLGDRVRLTPSLFAEVVGRLVYYPTYYAGLPHLIATTRSGDLRPVRVALAALLTEAVRTGNEGAFVAVECRDRPEWREPATPNANPLDLALLPPGVCQAWSALGPAPEVPYGSMVPALVLAGQFDPNIRPEQSHRVAGMIGRKARWIEFAGIGHNVRHFSPCAQRLVAAFIAKPESDQDPACANGKGKAVAISPMKP